MTQLAQNGNPPAAGGDSAGCDRLFDRSVASAPAAVNGEQSAIFVHSQLDDFGLTPAEFRLVAAIARRGVCFESVPKLAARCRMHEDTAWTALERLCDAGILERTPRPGRTTTFRVRPIPDWKQPTPQNHPPENKGHPSNPGGTHRKIRGGHPPENKGHKGNPTKVIPRTLSPDGAEVIYAAYPRQEAKGSALTAIGQALKVADASLLLCRTKEYAAAVATWPDSERRFIPHAAKWFGERHWEDDQRNWRREDPQAATNRNSGTYNENNPSDYDRAVRRGGVNRNAGTCNEDADYSDDALKNCTNYISAHKMNPPV